MGNALQKGSLDMSKYTKEASFQDTPTLKVDLLQNNMEINDKVLSKDITSVIMQMSPAIQIEVLKKIHSQPYWFTLIKFDEWNFGIDKGTIIHTKISGHTLEDEIHALKRGSLQPQIKNCWFIVTNLLLAVMDMEHRLDFHQDLKSKHIYLNPDRTMTILNPFIRQSHLDKFLQDVVYPSKSCRGWKPEFEQSYYSRMCAIDETKDPYLRDVHCIEQNKVQKMCESVGLIGLCLTTLNTENDFMVSESQNLDWDKITETFEMLEQSFSDKEFISLIRQMLLDAPKSLIALYECFTEAKLKLMTDGFRCSNFICADQIKANDLLNELRSLNAKYTINLNKKSKHGNKPIQIYDMPLPKWMPSTHPVPGHVAPSKEDLFYRHIENTMSRMPPQVHHKPLESIFEVNKEYSIPQNHQSNIQDQLPKQPASFLHASQVHQFSMENIETKKPARVVTGAYEQTSFVEPFIRPTHENQLTNFGNIVAASKLEILPRFRIEAGNSNSPYKHRDNPSPAVNFSPYEYNPLQKDTPSINVFHKCNNSDRKSNIDTELSMIKRQIEIGTIRNRVESYGKYGNDVEARNKINDLERRQKNLECQQHHDNIKPSCTGCNKNHYNSCCCVVKSCLCGNYNCGASIYTGLRPHSYCDLTRYLIDSRLRPAPGILYYDDPYYGKQNYRSGLWYHQ
jgi:hypothetical protein